MEIFLFPLHTSLHQSAVFLVWDFGGFAFCNISLRSLFSLWSTESAGKQGVSAYISRGHFSGSQPFIRSFTLAWSKKKQQKKTKRAATNAIQASLQLWPKHCTSVGGPIKVLHSSLWELQPPVKDGSLEQHIPESRLALPTAHPVTFSRRGILRWLLQDSVSVHLSVKARHG